MASSTKVHSMKRRAHGRRMGALNRRIESVYISAFSIVDRGARGNIRPDDVNGTEGMGMDGSCAKFCAGAPPILIPTASVGRRGRQMAGMDKTRPSVTYNTRRRELRRLKFGYKYSSDRAHGRRGVMSKGKPKKKANKEGGGPNREPLTARMYDYEPQIHAAGGGGCRREK